MGKTFIAVASAGYVWIFTLAGLQLSNFHLPHDIVTMAADSNDLAIAIVDGFGKVYQKNGVFRQSVLLYSIL